MTSNFLDQMQDMSDLGRMNDPTAAGVIRGPCGEEMEFYLYIREGIIEDVKFYSEGCVITKACAAAVAKRTRGRTVKDALAINPREIIDAAQGMLEEDCHCAILAVSTLYRAIADYLLKL